MHVSKKASLSRGELTKAILQSGLPASRRLVLVAVLDALDDQTTVILSVDRIARGAGLSHRTVHRALADLEAVGVIQRETRYQDGRRDGVIRSASRFSLAVDVIMTVVTALVARIRDALDAAHARMAVRLARRREALERFKRQRSATLSGFLAEDGNSSSSAAADIVVSGSVAENRAALKALYVPVHLRKAS